MTGTADHIYQDIALRTGGDIYIGVVGPVRTGKSTFVKRVMETLVIPNIDDIYRRERAKDELPQSGSGKTIMTAEPKFIPENAVQISPDGTAALSVRLIDSVGYMVPGAMGAEEDGAPRMVTTPWFPEEIPMGSAAELGTKKIMDEHCTIGIVVTTDGSATDLPREAYIEAETRAIQDMKAANKPFLVLLNSAEPKSRSAQALKEKLEREHQVRCLCVDCLSMEEKELLDILSALLYEFPIKEIHVNLPSWVDVLPCTHGIKASLFDKMLICAAEITTLSQTGDALSKLVELDQVEAVHVRSVDPATGITVYDILFPQKLFYQVLSEQSGFQLENDGQLLSMLKELSVIKTQYDKLAPALEQVQAAGYGIVVPPREEMQLHEPQIVKRGNNYSVKMTANASTIHMIRTDINAEICPLVGDEKQASDLIQYLMQDYDGNIDTLWNSSIFGRSVSDLITEAFTGKLHKMPDTARRKLQATLSRIVNEESSGLLCIILA